MLIIWRTWRRTPLTTAAVVALVAVSTSSVAALFGPLVNLVSRPLPYPQADRLVRISTEIPLFDWGANRLRESERLSPLFERIAAYVRVRGVDYARLSAPDGPADVAVAGVTPTFVETLGLQPRIGHSFSMSPPNPSAMLISERLWRTKWSGSPDIVGKSVRLGMRDRTIVGVLPTEANLPIGADVWVPMTSVAVDRRSGVEMIARLRPGASPRAATAALVDVKREFPSRATSEDATGEPVVEPLQTFLYGAHETTLRMLLTVASLFFLLSCAGIASLFVAQGIRDVRVTALQAALGASDARLIVGRLVATFGTVCLGGAVGLMLGWVENRWLNRALPEMNLAAPIDSVSLLLVVFLCFVVTVLCGLVPAVQTVRADAGVSLKPGSELKAFGFRRRRTSSLEYLAVAQLMVAIGLLSGTALLTKTLFARLSMSSGIDTTDVMAFRLELPRLPQLLEMQRRYFRDRGLDPFGRYGPQDAAADIEQLVRQLEPFEARERERNRLFFETLSNHLAGLASVMAVASVEPMPFAEESAMPVLRRAYRQRPAGALSQTDSVIYAERRVGPGVFAVLRMQFVVGRGFTEQDVRQTGDGAIPAVVGEPVARRLWPDENPIGKAFFDSTAQRQEYRIVGVVANDVFTGQPSRAEGAVYIPVAADDRSTGFLVRLRPGASPQELRDALGAILSDMSPALPRAEVTRLSVWERSSLRDLRVTVGLLTAFAILGVIVAGLGVCGIVTLHAAMREREMAVRLALGASLWRVRGLALWRAVRVAGIAVPGGVFLGWLLVRVLARSAGITEAGTALIYAGSSAVVVAIVLLAGAVPTLRLRSEATVTVMRQE
jgi:hypothetical protein